MSPRGDRLGSEAEVGLRDQVAGEVVPEAVDEDTAEVEHGLGAVSAPPHPGAIEPDADEVPDGPFHDAASDLEVGVTELGVLHPRHVLDEVVPHLAEHLAAVLVAGPGLGGGPERALDLGDDLLGVTTSIVNPARSPSSRCNGQSRAA
jgi:hypothetical protein